MPGHGAGAPGAGLRAREGQVQERRCNSVASMLIACQRNEQTPANSPNVSTWNKMESTWHELRNTVLVFRKVHILLMKRCLRHFGEKHS